MAVTLRSPNSPLSKEGKKKSRTMIRDSFFSEKDKSHRKNLLKAWNTEGRGMIDETKAIFDRSPRSTDSTC